MGNCLGKPNVVQVVAFDAGTRPDPTLHPAIPRIYMEYVEGGTLEAKMTAWAQVPRKTGHNLVQCALRWVPCLLVYQASALCVGYRVMHTSCAVTQLNTSLLCPLQDGAGPDLTRFLEIATDIARGMVEVHKKNVFRGLKPAKLLIDAKGRVKISGFSNAIYIYRDVPSSEGSSPSDPPRNFFTSTPQ